VAGDPCWSVLTFSSSAKSVKTFGPLCIYVAHEKMRIGPYNSHFKQLLHADCWIVTNNDVTQTQKLKTTRIAGRCQDLPEHYAVHKLKLFVKFLHLFQPALFGITNSTPQIKHERFFGKLAEVAVLKCCSEIAGIRLLRTRLPYALRCAQQTSHNNRCKC